MSIKVTSKVWDHSRHSGSALLVMLAIADYADEDGMAFPGLTSLAKKARTTVRNLHKVLDRLVESGELVIDHKNGIKTRNGQRTNRYLIQLDHLLSPVREGTTSLLKEVPPSSPPLSKEVSPSTSPVVNPGTPLDAKEVSPSSPEPSVKKNPPAIEPSERAAAGAAENIFTLYEKAFGKAAGSTLLVDELKDMTAEFALDWIADAFRETALAGARAPVKYARVILTRWQVEGKPQAEAPAAPYDSHPGAKYLQSKFADYYNQGPYTPEVNHDHSAGLNGNSADIGADAVARDPLVSSEPGAGEEDRGSPLQGDPALPERQGRSTPLLPGGHARSGLETDRAAQ